LAKIATGDKLTLDHRKLRAPKPELHPSLKAPAVLLDEDDQEQATTP
jgi:hypothetical protein